MPGFVHSEILFFSDNGAPMEFNIQYVKDKASIIYLIEHGGGLCAARDDVIHIVSPGATVSNVKPGVTLVSTSYIHDCVKQNYLLDIDEYRFVINEMEISDVSDNNQNVGKQKCEGSTENSAVDVKKSPPPKALTLACPSSSRDFDHQDSGNPVNEADNLQPSVQPADICFKSDTRENTEAVKTSDNPGETREVLRISDNNILDVSDQEAVELNYQNTSADVEIVSSSQPDNDDVSDLFDNMMLKKAEKIPVEKDDESLSENDAVSSSADAQVSPKVPSNTSAELFNSFSVPDSATGERHQYINDLEKEIEKILQKPSPKSIQDKIMLVKYICAVKKLAPAIVLQTLQNF